MKVFTSYYEKVPYIDSELYTFVRVSRKEEPEWFSNEHFLVDLSDLFGPTPEMLEECHPLKDWKNFEPRYKKEILGALDKEATRKEFEKAYAAFGFKPLVLLCYESSEENCHRHLIGDYLEMEITEL